MNRLRRFIQWIGITLLAMAVYQELSKPPEERTWHGRLAGAIPYDFRLPTLERLREAYWNPASDVVFTDRVLGVGWAVNIPALLRKVQVWFRASC